MITLLLSLSWNLTAFQEIGAYITLCIDFLASIILLWKILKAKHISIKKITKLITTTKGKNKIKKQLKEIINALEDEDEEEDKKMIHTELFTEWITNNGGADNALPDIFSKVPNIQNIKFSDAFVLNFADREIGFETEALFAVKLEGRAELVIPFYLEKLDKLSQIKFSSALGTEEELYSGKDSDSTTDSNNRSSNGKTDTTNIELPEINGSFDPNPEAASGQQRVSSEATETETGSGSRITTYGKKVIRTHDITKPEAQDLIEKVEQETFNIWKEIFKEFDSLFMGVW